MFTGTYGPDVTAGQTYISSGDESGATPPSEAFDDLFTSADEWRGDDIGAAANGVSYVGVQFSVPRRIRRCTIRQGVAGAGGRYVTSVLLQYSDNGSDWTTAATHNGLSSGDSGNLDNAEADSHLYWRFLANSGVQTGDTWVVNEAEMMEGIYA